MFQALRHRSFRAYWVALFISQAGTWMQVLGRGWLVTELTAQPFWLGAVQAAGTLPILLFSLFGGVAADRLPKRWILIWSNVFSAVIVLLLAILTAGKWITIPEVIVLAFLLGTVKSVELPAHQSLVVDMVGKEDLMNAIALNSSSFHSARIVGPAVAGIVVALAGTAACFFFNALSFIPVAVVLFFLKGLPHNPPRGSKSVWEDLREGLEYVRGERQVQALIALVGAGSFFGFPYLTMMPAFARDVFHVGAGGLGVLMAISGAGSVAGALVLAAGGVAWRKGRRVVTSGLVFGLSLSLFALSSALPLAGAVLLCAGFSMVTLAATSNTLVQTIVPDALRGRVLSLFTLVLLGMMPLGNLLVGILAGLFGIRAAVAIAGGGLVAAVASIALLRREVWRL